jgi:hypothetical protein
VELIVVVGVVTATVGTLLVVVIVAVVLVGVDGGLTIVVLTTLPSVLKTIFTSELTVCDEPDGGG